MNSIFYCQASGPSRKCEEQLVNESVGVKSIPCIKELYSTLPEEGHINPLHKRVSSTSHVWEHQQSLWCKKHYYAINPWNLCLYGLTTFTSSPGQLCMLHVVFCSLGPVQFSPPWRAKSHSRDLEVKPPPQVTEQGPQDVHGFQLPSTVEHARK
ncbi:hypothetical protein ElyMa_001192100 [Elysia marginata]|uniref:Uncharacterized protein n=1 Tax=Elysia marginata TaxID=1093978 RepID=A0AAV4I6E3_9GAST|nr:hypothetical protein ElyMa_001192100 [Elysia marginata]